jgi:hypothetical protein
MNYQGLDRIHRHSANYSKHSTNCCRHLTWNYKMHWLGGTRPIIPDKTHHSATSLAKHLGGGTNEIWYQGYHTNWTRREGTRGSAMSWPTRPEDPSHGLTNYCNFCCAIVKTSIDYWQIMMKIDTFIHGIKHLPKWNQQHWHIKSNTFIH